MIEGAMDTKSGTMATQASTGIYPGGGTLASRFNLRDFRLGSIQSYSIQFNLTQHSSADPINQTHIPDEANIIEERLPWNMEMTIRLTLLQPAPRTG